MLIIRTATLIKNISRANDLLNFTLLSHIEMQLSLPRIDTSIRILKSLYRQVIELMLNRTMR